MKKVQIVLVCLFSTIALTQIHSQRLKKIFNGKNLDGWHTTEENRWWKAEKGILSVRNTPDKKGSILWTKDTFTDFIVELDFLMGDGVVDSGVFLRSENDQIQIGISGSLKRDLTASPYIPKLRYPVEAKVSEILKPKEWNKMRIKSVGKTYTVWLNGQEVMTYTSANIPEKGPIGLQLHPNNEMSIQFRKIKLARL